jgi:hypothetical protein
VQWSEPDQLFVGYCPDLFIGGICHGSDEQKVYRELSRFVAAEIAEAQRAKRPCPERPHCSPDQWRSDLGSGFNPKFSVVIV